MPNSTVTPLSKKAQEAFIEYYKSAQDTFKSTRSSFRNSFEEVDLAYQREQLQEEAARKAKQANNAGDHTRFQDITVPVVMPQVEAAVTYQSSVFLTGDSIFGTVAAPEFMDAALQLETTLENQSIRGGWTRELLLFFRDGFKYNFAPLEITWDREVTYNVVTDTEKDLKEGQAVRVLWEGNKVRRLDPYNTFVDPRVDPSEVYKKGEFAGYTEIMSRIELKKFLAELPNKITANIPAAFDSTVESSSHESRESIGYYIPTVSNSSDRSDLLSSGGVNWMKWAGMSEGRNKNIDYKDAYEVSTMYCRILPGEFDLKIPNKNTPQVYKLIIVNHQWIIYAELQSNAHNNLGILVGQPGEDGLSYQTKSLGSNGIPFQQLATAYMASIIASRRRAVSDRALYDPSRISSAIINSANPSAKMPVRPKAYGEDISKAVYQFPYREDQQAASMSNIQSVLQLANQLVGQNPVSQGQFIKGNKTNSQFDDVMNNATGKDQMSALLLQAQVFTPMKEILKTNILQYQGGVTLFNSARKQQVKVDPIELRKAVLDFRLTDGLLSTDKVLNSEAFSTALQVLGSSPAIGQGYNLAPLFSYIVKTQGADLSPFEKSAEQLAYEEAVAVWQNTVQQMLDKGVEEAKLPPQPVPADFGYSPNPDSPPQESTESPLTPGVI